MARQSFGIDDYRALGDRLDLDVISHNRYVTGKSVWKCRRCGAKIERSYHVLKYRAHPCKCRWRKDLVSGSG